MCYQVIITGFQVFGGFCGFLGGDGGGRARGAVPLHPMHHVFLLFFFCKYYILKRTEPILYYFFITFQYYKERPLKENTEAHLGLQEVK